MVSNKLDLTATQRDEWMSAGYSLVLTPRQTSDFELLTCGAFSPLEWFMDAQDYEQVVSDMRLKSGALMPIPIVLDADLKCCETILSAPYNGRVVLRDSHGVVLALVQVRNFYRPDQRKEAQLVYGTDCNAHPGVNALFNQTHECYLESDRYIIQPPKHYDFTHLRKTPAQLKEWFKEQGWEKRIALQTRNPLHRAHIEMTRRAVEQSGAHLVIHPVVGETRPGDVNHFFRVRCYVAVLKYFDQASLSLLPLAMRMAGPREALWHALIRRNYGFTHFIVGRDHAGPGLDPKGKPYYHPDAAVNWLKKYQDELGIKGVHFTELVYSKAQDRYLMRDELTAGDQIERISGSDFRNRLRSGQGIPRWFTYPEVVDQLRKYYPPLLEQGIVIFFTGLSGAGKSTIANILRLQLLSLQSRAITLLDGDLVRRHLSSELGFSREHRDLNVTRVGFVAAEIARHGGIAICAMIAPYAKAREQVRAVVQEHSRFIEVFVDASVEECRKRDPKGLYKKSDAGLLKGLSGVDDPYEAPLSCELRIDGAVISAEKASDLIVHLLQSELRVPKSIGSDAV